MSECVGHTKSRKLHLSNVLVMIQGVQGEGQILGETNLCREKDILLQWVQLKLIALEM